MRTLSAAAARARFHRLIDRTAASGGPIRIIGSHNSAVLVSEKLWNRVQETLYLLSIPGLRGSIREGLNTPATKCAMRPGW